MKGSNYRNMQASIAKLGMETRNFTAREFADKLAEEERNWASRHTGIRDQSRLIHFLSSGSSPRGSAVTNNAKRNIPND